MSRVITALDVASGAEALALAARLEPSLTRLKVGSELFTAAGPDLVEALQARGFDVFLDLKYHDIPNTVAAACARAAALGVWMVNVHAAGGRRMLEAAREAVARHGQASEGAAAGERGTRLIAVTVLTSLAPEELAETGVEGAAEAQVARLSALAAGAGLDGVVCSAREVATVREAVPREFLTVTPGIRPAGSASDDQRRTLAPREAVLAGADQLVVGRPVTRAADPVAALHAIGEEIDAALAERGRQPPDSGP